MKKTLVLSFAMLFTLAACGGGSSGTAAQSSGAASAVVPILSGAMGSASGSVKSVKIDQAGGDTTLPAINFNCPTSGTVTSTGDANATVDSDPNSPTFGNFSFDITMATVFNTCAGTDTRCNVSYTLGGTVNSTSTGSGNANDLATAVFTIKQSGTVNITGFAAFDCPIDTTLTMTFAEMEALTSTTAVDGVLSKMTGTICGQAVADIKKLIDSDDATYCKGLAAAAGQTS